MSRPESAKKLPKSLFAGVMLGVMAFTLRAGAEDTSRERQASAFPATVAMPKGSIPEGIAIKGTHAFVTSLSDGTVYKVDLATGKHEVLTPASGAGAAGIMIDNKGRLFVAGGAAGTVRVIDSARGEVLATYKVATGRNAFVNDFAVLGNAIYVTDSSTPVLYKLPLGEKGKLPKQEDIEVVKLNGITYGDGFNVNGIAPTPDGKSLLVVQTNKGLLFRVDETTGAAEPVDAGGVDLTHGDGMLLEGNTLYVVRNMSNTVAVLQLDNTGESARLVNKITDSRFDAPTTIARYEDTFYLPNARFTLKNPTTADFFITAVRMSPSSK
jgi:sugar lactone lactonase YvrE